MKKKQKNGKERRAKRGKIINWKTTGEKGRNGEANEGIGKKT